MSETPTAGEITKVRRWECQERGHDFDTVVEVGSNDPKVVVCTHCGSSWEIGEQPEGLLRLADAWSVFLVLAARAEVEYGDNSPGWLDNGISYMEHALKGDPGHMEPDEFQDRRRKALQEHGPRLQWGQPQITEVGE